MPLDEALLTAAREAGARAAAAEREAGRAKAEYHHAIRRLQLSGATMREIASALNLSHQRVQQIVDANGGGRPWRRQEFSDTGTLICSFCGTAQRKAKKLVAGPAIYICDRCVQRAGRIAADHDHTAVDVGDLVAVGRHHAGQCGFCGKPRSQVECLVTTTTQPVLEPRKAKDPAVAICNECLRLCDEIMEMKDR